MTLGPKLRPLFWVKVPQVPAQSLWTDLVPPATFDQNQLERQFALVDSHVSMSSSAGKFAPRVSGPEESRKRIRVLDDRTSQLLAIAFNRLPPPERLVETIETLDEFPEALPAEAVLALHTASSEQQEPIEQLRQLNLPQTGISQLDMPERYLWVLASVPACAQKLACGALIVGPARELRDLRMAFQKVGVCCQALRKSGLLRKCISTSLAVGNFMNRGTLRSGAQAVVLPESLLKLDELRGIGESHQDSSGEGRVEGNRGPSLLDFVAQALVNEAVAGQHKELLSEAEALLAKARAAQKVSLEDAEASCNQVCAIAARARHGLSDLPLTKGVSHLVARVRLICDEADVAATLVKGAKEELSITQTWSSAKGKVKGDAWFAGWTQFLEQFAAALARASPPPEPPAPSAQAAPLASSSRLVLNELDFGQQLDVPPRSAQQRLGEPIRTCFLNDTGSRVATLALQRTGSIFEKDARVDFVDGAVQLKCAPHMLSEKQARLDANVIMPAHCPSNSKLRGALANQFNAKENTQQ